jgi:hypothetical protein
MLDGEATATLSLVRTPEYLARLGQETALHRGSDVNALDAMGFNWVTYGAAVDRARGGPLPDPLRFLRPRDGFVQDQPVAVVRPQPPAFTPAAPEAPRYREERAEPASRRLTLEGFAGRALLGMLWRGALVLTLVWLLPELSGRLSEAVIGGTCLWVLASPWWMTWRTHR